MIAKSILLVILWEQFVKPKLAIGCILFYLLVLYSFLPRIICENGTIHPKKYISWSEIKKVTVSNKQIRIYLKKTYIFNSEYVIECDDSSRDILLSMIKQKVNNHAAN